MTDTTVPGSAPIATDQRFLGMRVRPLTLRRWRAFQANRRGYVSAIIFGILFIASGFNIWLPILTHGFIDTVGLFLIYINADKFMKERVKIFG